MLPQPFEQSRRAQHEVVQLHALAGRQPCSRMFRGLALIAQALHEAGHGAFTTAGG